MEAIILAGGSGKRLRPLTDDIPKCMVSIAGKPLLEYQLTWLKSFGIVDIVIACGYKWEKIREHYKDTLVYSVEDEPLGTGGAIRKALMHIKESEFILVNSDDVTDVNITELIKLGSNSIAVAKLRSPYGVVKLEDDIVKEFEQKPLLPHWVWCGIALLDRKIPLPEKGAIENDTFPKIELKAFKHEGFWMTLNTQKDLEELEKALTKSANYI